MNATSPWVVTTSELLADAELLAIYEEQINDLLIRFYNIGDSCWFVCSWNKGGRMAFRAAYSPNDHLEIIKTVKKQTGITFKIKSLIGDYEVVMDCEGPENPVVHCVTSLKPAAPLLLPYWPRDIIPLLKPGNPGHPHGKVHISQIGTRSGLIYMSTTQPAAGSMLYMQNLTALSNYCQQTETSCADVVGGEWPELGFALPSTLKEKPLGAGKEVVLSDAYLVFDHDVPADEPSLVKQFLNLLAEVYLAMPKPFTHYQKWPETLNRGLKDLMDSPGCWSQVNGHHYFNAYVCDYATPPEIMVQLAILLPLLDYVEWSGQKMDVMKKIKDGLPDFYNEKLGTIMRWHPNAQEQLKGDEEQKQPMVMDSWYLHHPLLNLSRLALKGDKVAEELFLNSLEFSIKVAHKFNYEWPVFYKMDTLEIVKEETQPGKGGEKDVPGLYAHVMLQAWELTGKKRYLNEAEKAAKKLEGLGFELFYQANNTSFSAGALLRLFKITKKELYRELSYLCLASVFKNVRLWDCNYGFGQNFPSFFALFPLNDAPYTAVYEEQEVFCAFHDYLHHAEGMDILPSVRLLMAEYIRFLVERAMYYYPTMLPKEMLHEKPKTGELDPNLWIALEDMHDGWEQCGEVGQEVYGAGNAFGILPRHYLRVPGEDFMIYVDYPTYGFKVKKGKPVSFRLSGDERLTCRMLVVKMKKALPAIFVKGSKGDLKGKKTKEGHVEFIVSGNEELTVSWK